MFRSHVENAHGLVIALPVTRGCHTCHVCGKTFAELRYLRQHMEKNGEERFVCEKCQKDGSYKIAQPLTSDTFSSFCLVFTSETSIITMI